MSRIFRKHPSSLSIRSSTTKVVRSGSPSRWWTSTNCGRDPYFDSLAWPGVRIVWTGRRGCGIGVSGADGVVAQVLSVPQAAVNFPLDDQRMAED